MGIGVIAIGVAAPVFAQDGAVQEKIAGVEQAMAENAQKLHQYQWTETLHLLLDYPIDGT